MRISVDNECEECWTGFYLDSRLKCVIKKEHRTAWAIFALLMVSLIVLGMAIFVKKEGTSRSIYSIGDEYCNIDS